MIAIVDYGMGNLRSVQKSFENQGFDARISSDPGEVKGAAGVVLPGVGAFADAMAGLQRIGMAEALLDVVQAGRPLLGICLGLQLFFSGSQEDGWHQGLGLIPGRVERFPAMDLKVPHIGWNDVRFREHPVMASIPPESCFYFVHSYFVAPEDESTVLGVTEYGIPFTSAAGRENVVGLQFHPEKSSRWGLRLIKNFGEWVATC